MTGALKTDCRVVAAGDDGVAARVELDRVDVRLVALECVDSLPVAHIPHDGAPVAALFVRDEARNFLKYIFPRIK